MITVPAFRSAFRRRGARRIPDERPSRGRTAAAGRRTAAVCAALAVLVAGLAVAPAHADDSTPPPVDEAQAASAGAAPDRPTGLTVAAAHDRVALSWDDPGDPAVTGYQVLRRDRAVDAVGIFHTIEDDTATAATAYTDTTVTSGGSYVYRVKALNAHGASRQSSYARADIPQPPVIEEVEPPEPDPEPDPEPTAQPQIDCDGIWCATLTIRASGTNQFGTFFDEIVPNTFTVGGTTYTVNEIAVTAALFILKTTPGIPSTLADTLTLTIIDDDAATDYRLEDASLFSTWYTWSTNFPDWTAARVGETDDAVLRIDVANNEATGSPTIGPSPEDADVVPAMVGQRLTADIENIRDTVSDADGIPDDAVFACQWQRIEGSDASDISEAAQCTYVPVEADVGKPLQVQVTFTDSSGTTETVTSDPTAAVAASPYTEVVWSANLTPADLGNNTLGADASRGTLSPNTFELNTVTYTVTRLSERVAQGGSTLLVIKPQLYDVALQIGTRQFLPRPIGGLPAVE